MPKWQPRRARTTVLRHSQKWYNTATAWQASTSHPGTEGAEEKLKKISASPVIQALMHLMSAQTGPSQSLSREEQLTGVISEVKAPALTKRINSTHRSSIAHPHKQPPEKRNIFNQCQYRQDSNKQENRISRYTAHNKTTSSHQAHEVFPHPLLLPQQSRTYTPHHHRSRLDGSQQHPPAC